MPWLLMPWNLISSAMICVDCPIWGCSLIFDNEYQQPATIQYCKMTSQLHIYLSIFFLKYLNMTPCLRWWNCCTEQCFLFCFSAVGCAHFELPQNSHVIYTLSTAYVICNNTDLEWELTCTNNEWSGFLGNCTPGKNGTHTTHWPLRMCQ